MNVLRGWWAWYGPAGLQPGGPSTGRVESVMFRGRSVRIRAIPLAGYRVLGAKLSSLVGHGDALADIASGDPERVLGALAGLLRVVPDQLAAAVAVLTGVPRRVVLRGSADEVADLLVAAWRVNDLPALLKKKLTPAVLDGIPAVATGPTTPTP